VLLAGARRPVTPVGLKFGGGRVKSTGGAGTGRIAGAAATGRVAGTTGATVVGSGGKLSLNELAAGVPVQQLHTCTHYTHTLVIARGWYGIVLNRSLWLLQTQFV
jgi:hypothetical protein